MTALDQLTLAPPALAGLHEVDMAEANDLLERWGHYLGPCRRPFHQEGWVLVVAGQPVSVAVSASTVSSAIVVPASEDAYRRTELVELARLCSAERWATRVMLRLWREVAAPGWRGWPVRVAVAYSANDRHEGRIYRFDGWEKVRDDAGKSAGATSTWTKQRPDGHPAKGRKTLWIWRYDHEAAA